MRPWSNHLKVNWANAGLFKNFQNDSAGLQCVRQSSFLFYTAACSPALTAVYKCVAVTVCAHDQLSAHISSRITNIVQCAVSYIALSAVNARQSDNGMARLINMFHLRCNTDTQQPHHLNCIGLPSEPTAHNRSPPSINFAVLPV